MTKEVRAGRRDMLALVLFTARIACSLAVLAGVANPTPVLADPAEIGEWDAPRRWPAVAVHLILLPTGKVLFYRGDESTPTAYTWDMATEQIEQPVYPGDNIFCSAHSYLPDGRVLVIGGDTGDTGLRNQTLIFDPWTSQWSRGPSMRRGRYYPTSVSLGDGRVLVFSGKDENGDIVEYVEAYIVGGGPGGSDRWDLLPNSTRKMNYYPRMQLLPSGNVFHLGESPITEVFDPATGLWSIVANTNYTKRYQGTVVMLPPGHERFLITGGGDKGGAPTETAEIIDLSEPSPTWRYTDPMYFPRGDLNAVVLPDGKILVVGGTDDGDPIYPTEMFDPATETWSLMAPMATKRGYHSTALLLPDGRVLGAGANGNRTREIYSPPYLFRGARPVIDSAPSSVEYGETFSVETPDALRVATVVLMRLGSATHAANMEQRYVPLTFVPADADTLEVGAPTGSNVAPPGYYMLFILDADGIPSTAPFVHLRGQGTAPPTTSTTTSSSTTTTSEPIPTTTTTLPPGCGNGVVDVAGEECDGAADAACPGLCLPDCRCAIRVKATIEADVTVDENNPSTNFGGSTDLWADANEVRISFLRARVAGVGAGTIVQALLRLRTGAASNAASDSGGRVHAVYACSWDEATLTFNTRPAIDGVLLGTRGAVASNTTVEFDVTDALGGDGAYCFALDSLSENGVSYLSREASSGVPELWITYRPAAGGATTSTTTTTDPGPTTTSIPTTTTTTEPLPTTTSIPTTTTTLPPGCGNGVVDVATEDCDGAADAACPGLCLSDCRCTIRMQGTIEADATIDAGAPSTNFGASTDLWADADVAKTSLLRARVAGVGAGTVVQALLRLRTGSKSNAESESGGRLHTFSACGWNEAAVTWATRPAVDGMLLGTLGDVKTNTTVDFDVTAALTGDGAYCFALDSLSENGVTYVSREGSSGAPELWITYRPGAGGATTSTTTTTNAAPTTTSIPATTTTAAAPTTTSMPSTTTTTLAPAATVSVEARVAAGSDDAEEDSSRSVKLTSPDLDLTTDGTALTVGIRFAGVDIPPGVTITRAYIQFRADEKQADATSLVIRGEVAGNAPTFSTTAGNVSSRLRTTAAVSWPSIPAWTTVGEAGPNQRTPDISGVIQEIVSGGGWMRGNALAVIVTGTGLRTAISFEGGSTSAPLLHVEYGTP